MHQAVILHVIEALEVLILNEGSRAGDVHGSHTKVSFLGELFSMVILSSIAFSAFLTPSDHFTKKQLKHQ